jgi:hypothetical protein
VRRHGEPSWQEGLVAIERAYRREPALADRRARLFVDASVYGARRRLLLVELFHQLSAPGRATRWADELVARAPEQPAHQQVLAEALIAEGQIERANLVATRAAAMSGDPGRVWARLARRARLSAEPLYAVEAGRHALSLTAPGEDQWVLVELARAQRALGRDDDARATASQLRKRWPEERRAALEQRLPGLLEPSPRERAVLESLIADALAHHHPLPAASARASTEAPSAASAPAR